MSQSIKAAYDALLSQGNEVGVPTVDLKSCRLGIHLVNIAESKDGPSAGLAFAIAIASALTGRAVRPGLAVTGELSLNGNVIEVGGVPEKMHAAARYWRRRVLIPTANRADAEQVGDLKLDSDFVSTLGEALSHALV